MGARWVLWSVVLHHESRFLVAQHLLCRYPVAIAKPNWGPRRAPELRLQATALGLSRWQFLVRWEHKREWRAKPIHSRGELPHRRYRCGPNNQTPVSKIQLQRRHLYPLWRQLPERLGCVAILLAGQAQLGTRRSCQCSHGSTRPPVAGDSSPKAAIVVNWTGQSSL